MATVEDFILRMKVEGQGSVTQISGTIQNLKNDISDLSQIGGPLGGTINGIIGKLGGLGLAASVAGTAFVGLGARALQISGEMEDIAGSTGIATGVINSFASSMIFAGGKAEDAANILQRLNQSIQEAASGNENLQKSFQDLGIYVRNTNGEVKPTQEILQELTQRFQEGQLSSKQYTASIEILGKAARALDLQKLQAVNDPAYTEATKNIDKLNDVIDQLSMVIKRNLVVAFGDFAKAVAEGGISGGIAKITESLGNFVAEILNFPTDAIAGVLNLLGANIKNPVGLGTPVKALVEQAKKDRLEFQAENERIKKEKEKLEQSSKPAGTTPKGTGDFGETPEATKKAREASKKRIDQALIEQDRQSQLKMNSERLSALMMFADQEEAIRLKSAATIKEIEINSQSEINKAKLEIYDQERLSRAEKDKEYAAKKKEIELKSAAEIERARSTMMEQLKREDERIQNIITQSKARVIEEERLNDLLDKKNKFLNDNVTATDLERKRAQELFDLEEARLKVLREIALSKDLPPTERLAREKEINKTYDERRQKVIAQQEADKKLREDFNAGFQRAYRQYVEDSQNAFEQAGRLFRGVTSSFEENLTQSLAKGKLLYKDFFLDVVQQLIRSNIQSLIGQIFGGIAGANRLSNTSNIFRGLLGFANGGIIPTNGPVIVGERGPEIISGASGRVVTPNNQLGGTNVTYNISAVDAMSFKAMIASDPTFLYAVTEQGRRKLPGVA